MKRRERRRLWLLTGGGLALATAVTITTKLDPGWPAWLLAGAAALLAAGRDFVVTAWEKALNRIAPADEPRDPDRPRASTAVRVIDADPLLLGIRASEPAPSPRDKSRRQLSGLPRYVRRDVHAAVADQVEAAQASGGFVLLVGQSRAGKSRLAFEVVKELAGRWRLRVPADVAELRAWAENPRSLRQTVVWLEDLRPFLTGESGLTRAMLRDIVHSGHKVLIIGMIWTTDYNELTQPPETGSLDNLRHERELLTSRHPIAVASRFSETERREAWRISKLDTRIAEALKVTDFGVPQVLAHVPQLMQRWRHAPDSYGYAVITAAVDASRIGAREPVTAAFLEDAAAGYLTAGEMASAPARWFRTALKYATSPVDSTAAPLRPGPSKGTYIAADYLRHHSATTKNAKPPPRPLWMACATRITSTSDLRQVGRNAYNRGFDVEAERIWTAAHRRGDARSTVHLAELLIELDRLEDAETVLRHAITEHAANSSVRLLLGDLLTEQGNLTAAREVWQAGVAAGDPVARRRLAAELVKAGQTDDAAALWRKAIVLGAPEGLTELADMLEEHGVFGEAEALWRQAVQDGHPSGGSRLGALLSRQGHTDEAHQVLIRAIAAGDEEARVQLADQHMRLGRPDHAESVLRDGVLRGETAARHHLAVLLIASDRDDDARVLLKGAPPADHKSRQRLVDMLVARKKLDQAEAVCRDGIAAADPTSRIRLCDVLVALGRVDDADQEWRDAIDAGDPAAPGLYADWLVGLNRVPEARRVLNDAMEAGDARARERLDELQFDGHRRGRGLSPPERQPR